MAQLLDSLNYGSWALHALIWLPLVGMLFVLLSDEARAKQVALWSSIVVLVISLGLWWAFDASSGVMQMGA